MALTIPLGGHIPQHRCQKGNELLVCRSGGSRMYARLFP